MNQINFRVFSEKFGLGYSGPSYRLAKELFDRLVEMGAGYVELSENGKVLDHVIQ